VFSTHARCPSTMPTDAAALPTPPDIPPWKDSRPYSVGGNMHSNGQVTRPGPYSNGALPAPQPRFPNIKDLQDQAALLKVNEQTPVSTDNGYELLWGGHMADMTTPRLTSYCEPRLRLSNKQRSSRTVTIPTRPMYSTCAHPRSPSTSYPTIPTIGPYKPEVRSCIRNSQL
jgi:hypothetical protein